MPIKQAEFHHQWLPDEIFIEPAFSAGCAQLERHRGYKVAERSPIGRTKVDKSAA